jgi:hypothetical protein
MSPNTTRKTHYKCAQLKPDAPEECNMVFGNIERPCGTMDVFNFIDGMVSAVTPPSKYFSLAHF